MATYLSRDWARDWGSLRKFDTLVDAPAGPAGLEHRNPQRVVVARADQDQAVAPKHCGSARGQLQHSVVVRIGDVEVAGAVHRNPSGRLRPVNGSTVWVVDPGRQLQHPAVVVAPVGDVEVAGAIHRHPGRVARPVNGSTVWVVAPAANFSTRLLLESVT